MGVILSGESTDPGPVDPPATTRTVVVQVDGNGWTEWFTDGRGWEVVDGVLLHVLDEKDQTIGTFAAGRWSYVRYDETETTTDDVVLVGP